MHHPPHPAALHLRPEAAGPPRMPRALRFLRVLFSLGGTFSALAVAVYVFLLLSLYVFTPPDFEEWLGDRGFFVVELWVMPVLHGFRAVFYVLGAVRLGRGGRVGREGALVCVVVEVCAIVAGASMGAVLLGLPSAVDVVAWLFVVALELLWPGLLLLLLSVRSSREWFRATGA